MKRIFNVSLCCVAVLYLNCGYAQKFDSIEDELKYKKNQQAIKNQMYEEAKDAENKKSEMIRKNAFILVNCGPNFHKIWAFYKGVLYVADVPSRPSDTNINIEEVNFFPEGRLPSQTNYSRKGNKLFWNGNFAVRPGESWEYSLDSNTMYRKLPWGDIKTEECPTRIENGKP